MPYSSPDAVITGVRVVLPVPVEGHLISEETPGTLPVAALHSRRCGLPSSRGRVGHRPIVSQHQVVDEIAEVGAQRHTHPGALRVPVVVERVQAGRQGELPNVGRERLR